MGDLLRIVIFVAVLAVSTGCLYFFEFHDFYSPDSPTYVTPAANLLAGHGFVNAAGFPETNRTPGYPLLILLFLWAHFDLKYLIIFQHLLRAILIAATAAVAFRITSSQRTALLTGILLCLDLPLLEAANTILTEMFFTVTLAVILWLLWIDSSHYNKPGIYCWVAGLLSGASVLIRPINLLFVLPAATYLLLTRVKFKLQAALSFVLVFLCLPLIWAARNYYETGYFTVTSISGSSMLLYRAAAVLAINDPGEFNAKLQERQIQLQEQACKDMQILDGMDCSQETIPRKSNYYSHFGHAIVLAHPFAYVKTALRGVAVMFLGGGLVRFKELTGVSQQMGRTLLLSYTFPVLCFAIMGLSLLWDANRPLFTIICLVVLYYLMISAGGEADSRFRVPFIPLYAFVAAIGLEYSLKRFIAMNDLTARPLSDTLQSPSDEP